MVRTNQFLSNLQGTKKKRFGISNEENKQALMDISTRAFLYDFTASTAKHAIKR